MNPLRANFQELYQRHLCRHSQYGLNVNHLVAVAGTYLGLFGIIYWLGGWWALAAVTVPYLAVLALNVPARVFAVLLIAVAALFGLFVALPDVPAWVYPIVIVVCHQVQQWGHKVYAVERDMTAFNQKYKRGPALFVLLALYELPILLNYLVFDRQSWAARQPVLAATVEEPVAPPA
jgi:hypothetical protein